MPAPSGRARSCYLDGTLILSVLDGERVRVMAVDAASGKQLWTSEKAYRGSTVDYIRWNEMHGGTCKPASSIRR